MYNQGNVKNKSFDNNYATEHSPLPTDPIPLNAPTLPSFSFNINLPTTATAVIPTAAIQNPPSVFGRLGTSPASQFTPATSSSPFNSGVFSLPKPTGSFQLPALTTSSFSFTGKASPFATKETAKSVVLQPCKDSRPDIEFVEELRNSPPKDLVDKAAQLQLPRNFYNYVDKPECKGCRGCKDDDPTTKCLGSVSEQSTVAVTPASGRKEEPKSTFTFGFSSAAKDVPTGNTFTSLAALPKSTFGTPAPFTFGIPASGESVESTGITSTSKSPKHLIIE